MNDTRAADFKRRVFALTRPEAFNALCLEIFCFQFEKNPVYRQYCTLLGVTPGGPDHFSAIPFLPIEFYRTHRIATSSALPEFIFHSSGTTGSTPSTHYVFDALLYETSILRSFSQFYGDPKGYCMLALTPTPAERPYSSLAYMADVLIRASECPQSGFFLGREAELAKLKPSMDGRQTLLLGLSYALADLAEKYPGQLRPDIVIETGGMKGRRQELTREELHLIITRGLGVRQVHSEYSMCELFSQAWSQGEGIFDGPPWMKILLRDPQDPLSTARNRKRGGINVIDLANIDTCAFIATQDLGEVFPDGRFRVNGRFDHSALRGCSLMLE